MAEGSLEKGWMLDPDGRFQSRIDEQAELICILKKRTDTLILEAEDYKAQIRKLEKTQDQLKSQIENEKTQSRMIEQRFDDLADNHQELIKYKDMYKSSAAELQEENVRLRLENSSLINPQIEAKNKEIKNWQDKTNSLLERLEKLEKTNTELSDEKSLLEDKTLKQSTTISDLQERLRISEERNDELESSKTRELEKAEKLHNLELHSLRQENKNYMDMAFERGKAVQSKENLIASLQAELNEKNKKLESIDSEWANAKGKLTKDATVIRLMQENEEFRG
ncbi:Oidioi.mRNA.OKI2018_I69.chr1.g3846.t1.cds [Oikopleura dioica]|uniref:Oidioi.mRNA.OKI2018_I69.chr1.g3846.t1.cds n=1 Tax=Oikopleura dioica TaxID=34765 RepID=A0ABN7T0X5_OIKDI|nr:Oidioi.mRNA.OKI2018_I69.chr1.g3846.t1.cds [Oikopleura dioica]